MSFSAEDLETIASNALAAGRALHPQPLSTKPCLRVNTEDDVAEDVTRAFTFESGDQSLWLGLTAFAVGMHPEPIEEVARRTLRLLHYDLWPVALQVQAREATLAERIAAITPRPGREVVTVTIDVKLSQLMSTSLAVLDVVRSG